MKGNGLGTDNSGSRLLLDFSANFKYGRDLEGKCSFSLSEVFEVF